LGPFIVTNTEHINGLDTQYMRRGLVFVDEKVLSTSGSTSFFLQTAPCARQQEAIAEMQRQRSIPYSHVQYEN
jgi:hypothetical protein